MSKPFVLVVEDSFIIAHDTYRVLEDAGYRVAMTDSAEAALTLARADPPQLAIVDLKLTDGMTGAGVARQLRALGCAVVICTGFDGPLAESWAKHIGAVDVLHKPVSPADMLEAVEGALESRR